jgi:hypothetical protein
MIISRDRYLDETSRYHLTISLATRTGIMHSLLSNIPDEERASIGEILVQALNEIEERIRPHVAATVFTLPGARPER